jgi:hypothetical protein
MDPQTFDVFPQTEPAAKNQQPVLPELKFPEHPFKATVASRAEGLNHTKAEV